MYPEYTACMGGSLHARAEGNDSGRARVAEAARRNHRRDELKEAIAANVANEPDEHRWVDLQFDLRGVSEVRYQILQRHHNLLRLDAEMGAVVDEISREWELQQRGAEILSSGFEYRTLTYRSGDAGEHRSLAETVLQRVYRVDIADVDGIERSP
jgi:uncharacterized protein with von Willebrand factor type A (vWA) domain